VQSRLPAVGLALVLAVALALRAPLLGGGQIDYDEGVYWQSLRALAAGHPLFSSVYSSQPPAFLTLLLPAHVLLGGTMVADRAVVLALALAGIVAVYRTAGRLAGGWAGVTAAALLAADPLYFRQSVTLQADGPAVALALAAVALAAETKRGSVRESVWLAGGAGVLLAAAVLTKLLAIAAGPAVALLLVVPAWPRSRVLVRLGAAAAGGLAVAAVGLLPFAGVWPELWRQVVGFHLGARALPVGGLDGQTVLLELPVAVLGLTGFALAARRAPPLAAAGAALAVPAGLLLLVQHPLWPHHLVALTAPLALLGGGLATVRWRQGAAAVGALLLIAASVASALHVRGLAQPDSVLEPTVAALRTDTAPGDLVVTDDQYGAALAGRSTPPELVDTSLVRIRSGDLTVDEVERIAGRDDVRAVLLATDRLVALPGLTEWLQQHYGPPMPLGGGRALYVRSHP
jgi:4-amino-4-deoxy-L-arabinose transferase-like glycosyltransferase